MPAPSTALAALRPGDFQFAQARHLLLRLGLGASWPRIEQAVVDGLSMTLDRLFGEVADPPAPTPVFLNPNLIRPPTPEEQTAAQQARVRKDEKKLGELQAKENADRAADAAMLRQLQDWWLSRCLLHGDGAAENMVLLWHSHFCVKHRDVYDTWLLWRQQQLFRSHGMDFASLTRGIVADPAMIKFLNNDRNTRTHPNENLARELMELFTLGEGRYGEKDVQEGARALTGHFVADNDFYFDQQEHDPGMKRILGQAGYFKGNELADLLLAQPDCPRFIAVKLIRHFLADIPVDVDALPADFAPLHLALSAALTKHNGQLAEPLRLLFSSQAFYAPQAIGTKVKSPVQILASLARSLGIQRIEAEDLAAPLVGMGQELFNPPSVAGWDGGAAWLSTSALLTRQNACAALLTRAEATPPTRERPVFSVESLRSAIPHAGDEQLVERLCDLLLGPHVGIGPRRPIHAYARKQPLDAVHLRQVVLLISAAPEFQLC